MQAANVSSAAPAAMPESVTAVDPHFADCWSAASAEGRINARRIIPEIPIAIWSKQLTGKHRPYVASYLFAVRKRARLIDVPLTPAFPVCMVDEAVLLWNGA